MLSADLLLAPARRLSFAIEADLPAVLIFFAGVFAATLAGGACLRGAEAAELVLATVFFVAAFFATTFFAATLFAGARDAVVRDAPVFFAALAGAFVTADLAAFTAGLAGLVLRAGVFALLVAAFTGLSPEALLVLPRAVTAAFVTPGLVRSAAAVLVFFVVFAVLRVAMTASFEQEASGYHAEHSHAVSGWLHPNVGCINCCTNPAAARGSSHTVTSTP